MNYPTFSAKLVNRAVMPRIHVVVCEDIIEMQAGFARRLAEVFGGEGEVQVSLVCGGAMAAAIINAGLPVDALILDHDMPWGDGGELLKWLAARAHDMGPLSVPRLIVGASGIPINNQRMLNLGAHAAFTKDQIFAGAADEMLLALLTAPPAPCPLEHP